MPTRSIDAAIRGMTRDAGASPEVIRSVDEGLDRQPEVLRLAADAGVPILGTSPEAIDLAEERVRVVAPDVGGSFGIKIHVYQDDLAACALAAVVAPVAAQERPAVGPERPFQLAPRVERTLPNGLRIVVARQAAVPAARRAAVSDLPIEHVRRAWLWSGVAFVVAAAVLAVVFLFGFALWERREPQPLVPREHLRNRVIVLTNVITFLSALITYQITVFAPIFVQVVKGDRATKAGFIIMPLLFGNFFAPFPNCPQRRFIKQPRLVERADGVAHRRLALAKPRDLRKDEPDPAAFLLRSPQLRDHRLPAHHRLPDGH